MSLAGGFMQHGSSPSGKHGFHRHGRQQSDRERRLSAMRNASCRHSLTRKGIRQQLSDVLSSELSFRLRPKLSSEPTAIIGPELVQICRSGTRTVPGSDVWGHIWGHRENRNWSNTKISKRYFRTSSPLLHQTSFWGVHTSPVADGKQSENLKSALPCPATFSRTERCWGPFPDPRLRSVRGGFQSVQLDHHGHNVEHLVCPRG